MVICIKSVSLVPWFALGAECFGELNVKISRNGEVYSNRKASIGSSRDAFCAG